MKNNIESPVYMLAISALFLLALPAFAQQPAANSLVGSTDIPAYIEEALGLAASLAETAQRAFGNDLLQPDHQAMDDFYRPVEEKYRRVQQQYEDFYKKKMDGAGPDMEAMNREIERNPIVKNMGGVQAIQNMSQEEAKQAATQATAQFVADPFAASGVQSPGMTALYQKMMSDPAYAQRFQKMTEQERMVELQKYMANDPLMVKTPEQVQQANQQMARRDEVVDAMEINGKITELTQEIQNAVNAYGEGVNQVDAQPGNHAGIDAKFGEKYNALPEIIAGEVGKVKDPEMEKKLRMETAAQHRERAAADLKQYSLLLQELKVQYKQIASSYMQFIAANAPRVNGNMADLYAGTNTELNLANFEASLLGLGLDLIKKSRELTSNVAFWEQNYQQVMSSYGAGN